jgi:hypothetical protein
VTNLTNKFHYFKEGYILNKKKKKKPITKRRVQAKTKKQQRAKAKIFKSKPDIQFIHRPALTDIEAPDGFRTVTMTQGLIEYASPVMELAEKNNVKDPNEALQVAVSLWNFNIANAPVKIDREKTKKDVIKQIGKLFKMDPKQSADFVDMMLQRKGYLFPVDIQPADRMTMFIRKEQHFTIAEFNYDKLKLSDESYTPDDRDKRLVKIIDQMDSYIADDVDYEEWEDFYFKLENEAKERFQNWLVFKGAEEYSEDFSFYVGPYLNFIYRYMHEHTINLKSVLPIYIEEFFVDHILRKIVLEPLEYTRFVPALKLFYNFLHDIDYLQKPEKIIKFFNAIEPLFIEILRERYS